MNRKIALLLCAVMFLNLLPVPTGVQADMGLESQALFKFSVEKSYSHGEFFTAALVYQNPATRVHISVDTDCVTGEGITPVEDTGSARREVEVQQGVSKEIIFWNYAVNDDVQASSVELTMRVIVQPDFGDEYEFELKKWLTINHSFVASPDAGGETHSSTCTCGLTGASAEPHDWVIEQTGDLLDGQHAHKLVCSTCHADKLVQCVFQEGDTVDPTCTLEGHTVCTCLECGYSYNRMNEGLADHTWGNPNHTEGTEGETATHSRACSECGEAEAVSPCELQEGDTVAASCTEKGHTVLTCTECGYSYDRMNEGLAAHSWSSYSHTAETEGEAATHSRTCTECGEAEAASGCVFQEGDTVDPTCTVEGHTVLTCAECGYSYNRTNEGLAAHSWSSYNHTEGTEGSAATHSRTCTECGEAEAASGCVFQEGDTVDPTCTVEGHTVLTCAECGYSYNRTNEGLADHSWGSYSHTEGTEGSAATHSRTCEICGETETQSCSFGEGLVTPPTCDSAGFTTHSCSVCEYHYQDQETQPTGEHAVGSWTDLGNGSHEGVCTVCEAVLTNEHVNTITSQSDGAHITTCDNCGASTTADALACAISLSAPRIPVGIPITANWTIIGGLPPYEVEECYWVTRENGVETVHPEEEQDGSATFSTDDGFGNPADFVIRIKDSLGATVQSSATFDLTADWELHLQVDMPGTVAPGEAITASWSAPDGVDPLEVETCQWSIKDSEGNEIATFGNNDGERSTITVPTDGASGTLTLKVKDAISYYSEVTKSFSILAENPEEPLSLIVTLDKTTVAAGETITASWAFSDNNQPFTFHDAHWKIWDANGATNQIAIDGSEPQAELLVRYGIRGLIYVSVQDSEGSYYSVLSDEFTITGAPPPLVLEVNLDKETVEVNTAITASWTVTGGEEPYEFRYASWSIRDVADSNSWYHLPSNESGNTSTATPGHGVNGHVQISVADATGRTVNVDKHFDISGSPDPLQLNVTLNQNSVEVGSTITASWDNANETPYEVTRAYWTIWSTENDSQNISVDAIGNTASYTPVFGMRGSFTVVAKDSSGREYYFSTDTFDITDSPDPLVVVLHLPDTVAVDNTITASWEISGGQAPYTVETAIWNIKYEEDGPWYGDSSEYSGNYSSITPRNGVRGMFNVYIVDALGQRVNRDGEFTITGSSAPLAVNLMVPETVAYGNDITATWEVTGGVAPYRIQLVSWDIKDSEDEDWAWFANEQFVDSSTITPNHGIRGKVEITVVDDSGRFMVESKEFTITGSPDPLSVNITLDKTTVESGSSVTANWTVNGGVEPVQIVHAYWFISDANDYLSQYDVENPVDSASLLVTHGVRGHLNVVAEDGTGSQRTFQSAEFTITGSPEPLTVNIILDKDTVQAGNPITATWQFVGGIAPYTLEGVSWHFMEDGQDYWDWISSEYTEAGSTITPYYGHTGRVTVSVKDSTGRLVYVEKEFTITDALVPPTASISLDKETIEAGSPITANWEIAGGVEPTSIHQAYWMIWTSEGSNSQIDVEVEGNRNTFTPIFGERGQFVLIVQDATERTKHFYSDEFTITGSPGPLTLVFELDKTTVEVSNPITVTWTITGGVEPYTFQYQDWGLRENEDDNTTWVKGVANGNSSTFVPKYGRYGKVNIYVKDAVGQSVSKTLSFEVTGSPAPISANLSLDADTVAVDTPITASWSIENTADPVEISYSWHIYQGDNHVGGSSGNTDNNSSQFTPLYGDSGYFQLHIKDGLGRDKYFGKSFTITGSPEPFTVELLVPDTVAAGSPITATWTIENAVEPVYVDCTWAFYQGEEHVASPWNNFEGNSSTFIPVIGNRGVVNLYVSDGLGRYDNFSKSFTITGTTNPIKFKENAIEVTRYKNVEPWQDGLGSAVLWMPLDSLGEPIWSLTHQSGNSVDNIRITEQYSDYCNLNFDNLLAVGDTEYLLTCSLGEHTASIPVIVHVLDENVPTDFTAPTMYQGVAGEAIFLPRPTVLTEGTNLESDWFHYGLYVGDGIYHPPGTSETGYNLTFEEPGYYWIELRMIYANIYLEKKALVALADENGVVPGVPFDTSPTTLDLTYYLAAGHPNTSYGINIHGDISLLEGSTEWHLENIEGDSVSGLYLIGKGETHCSVGFESMDKAGLTTADLICKRGPYQHVVSIRILVKEGPIPTDISFATTFYVGKTDEEFLIEPPSLIPDDTTLTSEDFQFDIQNNHYYSDVTYQPASYKNWRIAFHSAGYYTMLAQMRYGNIYLSKNLVFKITDSDGSINQLEPITELQIDTSPLLLSVGDACSIFVNTIPENPSIPTLAWSSGDEQVVRVDQEGNIRAFGVGHATITASTLDGSELSISRDVQVFEPVIVTFEMPDTVAAGSPIHASWTVSNYVDDYEIESVSWYVREGSQDFYQQIQTSSGFEGSSNTFTPLFGTDGFLNLTLTDGSGRRIGYTKAFTITGSPAPMAVNLSLDADTVAVDTPITANWSIENAVEPVKTSYSWDFYQSDNHSGGSSGSTDSSSCQFTPLYGDRGEFNLHITDALGRSISSSKSFAITGTTNPIRFADLDPTYHYYLKNQHASDSIDIQLSFDLGVLGQGHPTWTLTPVTGSFVNNLHIRSESTSNCTLIFDNLIGAGEAVYDLTCSLGEYSTTNRITLHVSDAEIPTTMTFTVPSDCKIGEPIHMARPQVQTEGTPFDSNQFEFHLNPYGDSNLYTITGSSEAGYDITYNQAGYHRADVIMVYAGIHITKSVLFQVKDAEGTVPGNPFTLAWDELRHTQYIKISGNSGHGFHSNFVWEDISWMEGTPVWTLENIVGTSVRDLYVEPLSNGACAFGFHETVELGVTTADMVCTIGGYSAITPIIITVSDADVPMEIDMPTLYTAKAGESFHIPRPGLLPKDTDLPEEGFDFRIHLDSGIAHTGNSEEGYTITITEPGYYQGQAQMYSQSRFLSKDLTFKITDEEGQVPFPYELKILYRDDTIYLSGNVIETRVLKVYLEGTQHMPGVDEWVLQIDAGAEHIGQLELVPPWGGDSRSRDLIQRNPLSPGVIKGTITCKTGELESSVPFTIQVSDGPVPIAYRFTALPITGEVNQAILIPWPAVLPENAGLDPAKFDWGHYSPDASHFDKSDEGYLVTFREAGRYPVSIHLDYSNAFVTQEVLVIVNDPANPLPAARLVAQIKLDDTQVGLGQKTGLSRSIIPADADFKVLAWSSSDNSIATVDNDGTVTGIRAGIATITASATDGSGVTGSCVVQVFKPIQIDIAVPATVEAGSPITATWTVPADTGPYEIVNAYWLIWSSNDTAQDISAEITGNSSTFTPKFGQRGSLNLEVRDAVGNITHVTSPEFAITGSPDSLSLVFELDKTTVEAGHPITATWTITGGVEPYSFVYQDWGLRDTEEGNNNWVSGAANGNSSTFIPKYGSFGTVDICVKDATGQTVSDRLDFVVTGSPEPLTANIQLDKTTVAAGETITATWSITGGVEPYRIEDAFWILEDNEQRSAELHQENPENSAILLVSVGTRGRLVLHINDAVNNWQRFESQTFEITDGLALMSLEVNLDKTTVNAGEEIRVTWQIEGGTPPYTVQELGYFIVTNQGEWAHFNLPINLDGTSFTPHYGQRGNINVLVLDANGYRVSSDHDFTITNSPPAPLCVITADKDSVQAGETIQFTWEFENGQPPYTLNSAGWTIQESNGETYWIEAQPEDKHVSLTPRFGQSGSLYVSYTDNKGWRFSQSHSFEILNAPEAPLTRPSVVIDCPEFVELGQPITATWTLEGGDAPLVTRKIDWETHVEGEGYLTARTILENLSGDTFIPRRGEKGYLLVEGEDALGRPLFGYAPFDIKPASEPLQVVVTLPETVAAGTPVTASWTITGGADPTVEYGSWNLYENQEYVTGEMAKIVDNSSSFTPQYGDSCMLHLAIKDQGTGETTYVNTSFVVTDSPTPPAVAFTLPDSVEAGKPITVSWEYMGGKAPFEVLNAQWVIRNADNSSELIPAQISGNQSILTPGFGKSGQFNLTVRDATGREKHQVSSEFSITQAPKPLSCDIALFQGEHELENGYKLTAGNLVRAQLTWKRGEETLSALPSGAKVLQKYWEVTQNTSTQRLGNGQNSFIPRHNGSLSFHLMVQDELGTVRSYRTTTFEVTGALTPLQLTFINQPQPVDLNKPEAIAKATWQVSGRANANFTVQTTWYILEDSSYYTDGFASSKQTTGTAGSYAGATSYKPTSGTEAYLQVRILDQDTGISQSYRSDSFTIKPKVDPITCTIELTDDHFDQQIPGDQLSATWHISGGVKPYRVEENWLVYATEGNQTTEMSFLTRITEGVEADDTALEGSGSAVPTFGQEGHLTLAVTDARGVTRWFYSDRYTIAGVDNQPLSGSVTITGFNEDGQADASSTDPLEATWDIVGGKAPYKVKYYYWHITEDESTSFTDDWHSFENPTDWFTSVSYAPKAGKQASFELCIEDANNTTRWLSSPVFEIINVPQPLACAGLKLVGGELGIPLGQETTASFILSGGQMSHYQVEYWWLVQDEFAKHHVLQEGHALIAADEDGAASYTTSFMPTFGQRLSFHLQVKDKDGYTRHFSTPVYDINNAGNELFVFENGTITGLTDAGKMQENKLVIPAVINGIPVTSFGPNALAGCNASSILLSENLASGALATQGLWSMTHIEVVPGNPHFSSKDGVLFNKDGSTLLVYPKARDAAPYSVPAGTQTIGASAFAGSKLTSITLPEGLSTIQSNAFYESWLPSITLPASMSNIAVSAFADSSLLTSFRVSSNNHDYHAIDGVLFNKDGTDLVLYPSGRDSASYQLPDAVTTIRPGALASNLMLKHIYNVGEDVTTTGAAGDHQRFYGPVVLETLTVNLSDENDRPNLYTVLDISAGTYTLQISNNEIAWVDEVGNLMPLKTGKDFIFVYGEDPAYRAVLPLTVTANYNIVEGPAPTPAPAPDQANQSMARMMMFTKDASDTMTTQGGLTASKGLPVRAPALPPSNPRFVLDLVRDQNGNILSGNALTVSIETIPGAQIKSVHWTIGGGEGVFRYTEDAQNHTCTILADTIGYGSILATITLSDDQVIELNESIVARDKLFAISLMVDGSLWDTVHQAFDTPLNLPVPSKLGHAFKGWRQGEGPAPVFMPQTDLELTAQFEAKSYSISYRNGDTLLKETSLSYGQVIDSNEFEPAEPAREGYGFDGWTPELPATMPAHNLNLQAKWKAETTYDLIFNANGGKFSGDALVSKSSLVCGARVADNLPLPPTRTNYTFEGWEGMSDLMPAGTLTLYAKWAAKQITIVFDPNQGQFTSTDLPSTYAIGTALQAPEVSREGYDLLGWSPLVPDKVPSSKETPTYKAIWQAKEYQLTYHISEGDQGTSITMLCGQPIQAPETPTREGFIFTGWSPDFPGTMPAHDVEVTAQWKEQIDINSLDADYAVPDTNYVYNGEAQSPLVNMVHEEYVLNAGTDFVAEYIDNTAAGEASIKLTGIGDYKGERTLTFIIQPKVVGLTWNNTEAREYDGKASTVTATVTGLITGDACNVTVTGGDAKNADTHTATAESLDNPNYKLPAEVTTTYTITSKEVGLDWFGTNSRNYSGQASNVTAKATGLVQGDACAVEVTGGTAKTAGTHTATATALSNLNYKLPATGLTQTYTINPKVVGLTWNKATARSYDGKASAVTATATGLITGDTCSVTVTGGTAKAAGTHTATATALSNLNYKLPTTGLTQAYTISPKVVGLTWNKATARTYDGKASAVTATATGLIAGDTCSVTVTGGTAKAAGAHTATATALSNLNYKLPTTGLTQTYTINPKAVGLTWNNTQVRTYDGKASAVTATATGLIAGDACSVTVTGGTAKAAGTHTATASALSNTNYKLPTSGLTMEYKITPALVDDNNLEIGELVLNMGENTQLVIKGLPENTSEVNFNWTSTNPEVASVDENGKIHASKPGSATITITSADGSEVLATCEITVNSNLLGDANNDGDVEASDLGHIIEFLIAKQPLNSKENANVDEGIGIDVNDLLSLIEILVGD